MNTTIAQIEEQLLSSLQHIKETQTTLLAEQQELAEAEHALTYKQIDAIYYAAIKKDETTGKLAYPNEKTRDAYVKEATKELVSAVLEKKHTIRKIEAALSAAKYEHRTYTTLASLMQVTA